jgi:hypothetical protein
MTNLQRLSEKSYLVTADMPLPDVKSDDSEFSDDRFKHEKRLNRLSAHKKRTRSISEYLKINDKIEEGFFRRLDSCYGLCKSQ